MIQPTLRASLSREDAARLVDLVSEGDPDARAATQERLEESGVDAVLDDPRVLNAVLSSDVAKLRPELIVYLLVRHVLLEGGVDDVETADYVSCVVFRFRDAGRAFRLTDGPGREYRYLVDHVEGRGSADPRHRFLVNLHLGDFALWMTGIFPDRISARVDRRGAPPASYFEEVGIAGYRTAASSDQAQRMGLDGVLSSVANQFSGVRVALNRFSDRYLWREGGDPVEKLIREVSRGGV